MQINPGGRLDTKDISGRDNEIDRYSYYADEKRALALLVLDTLARQPSRTPALELLNLCKHRDPSLGKEQFREVLTILSEDHYIDRTKCESGMVCDFRWPLIKKWWKETRP